MMTRLLAMVGRGWRKLIVGPLRYGTRDGYRAESYWHDRLGRGGSSLSGPGHEGWSEEENRRAYEAARRVLEALPELAPKWVGGTTVLEIGPGTGFWTEVSAERGVRDLVGYDITDIQFEGLRHRFPDFRFLKGDATEALPAGSFGLILILDVIEHVVTPTALEAILQNAVAALEPDGLVVVSFPPPSQRRRDLFYLRFWEIERVAGLLAPCVVGPPVRFRDGVVLLGRRP